MPFICMIRNDIPDGVLQVLDLSPNESQRNLIYEPRGQTKYVRRFDEDSVATSGTGPITTTSEAKGLAAYLIDNVEDTDNGNIALTASRANTIASSVISTLESGSDVTTAVVNAAIQAATGGATATLTNGDSTGSLTEVLKVLAGGEYVLPSGSEVEDSTNNFVGGNGSFTSGQYLHTRQTGSLEISLGEGHLAGFVDSTFEYGGTSGAALVVLDDDGTVMSALS